MINDRQEAVTGATDVLLDKFRARCAMVDPITREPRFGPKMLARVQELLQRYDSVKAAVDETSELVAQVEQHAATRRQEALEHHQREEQERLRLQEAEAARLRAIEAERVRIEAEAQAQRALEHAREQERIATLARLAQQKRDERARAQQEEARRAQEAAERRAQAAAAFPVGRVGLERAIALLHESTGSATALKQALTKLHAIASAICAAPENAAIRRIPKRNAHFVADLGQFRGGYECLQALGFAEVEETTRGDGKTDEEDESATVVYVLEVRVMCVMYVRSRSTCKAQRLLVYGCV